MEEAWLREQEVGVGSRRLRGTGREAGRWGCGRPVPSPCTDPPGAEQAAGGGRGAPGGPGGAGWALASCGGYVSAGRCWGAGWPGGQAPQAFSVHRPQDSPGAPPAPPSPATPTIWWSWPPRLFQVSRLQAGDPLAGGIHGQAALPIPVWRGPRTSCPEDTPLCFQETATFGKNHPPWEAHSDPGRVPAGGSVSTPL